MSLRMDNQKIYYDCILCERPFQFGPHIYDGRHISAWDVEICQRCIRSNWDGIVTSDHPRLVEHLNKQGVQIKLNPKGWLDIPE